MNIRTDWLIAIKDAKDAGLDSFAYALMATHDLLFPSEPLKPLYDRMALENLNRNRQLKEIPAERPLHYYRLKDGSLVRSAATEAESFNEFCDREDREQAEEDEQREVEDSQREDFKAWRRS